ncbi:MAG TPA: hypothetical protein VFJ82_06105 [Longimicrobium sp.]|nr:hypothetical protein [Longimicrobium sp.]
MSNRAFTLPLSLAVLLGVVHQLQRGTGPSAATPPDPTPTVTTAATTDAERRHAPDETRSYRTGLELVRAFLVAGDTAPADTVRADTAHTDTARATQARTDTAHTAAPPPNPCFPAIGFMVATLPDPVDSHLDWAFDSDFEAILRAYERAGYVLDRFWLPWNEKRDTARAGPGGTTVRLRDVQPGVVLFRLDTVVAPRMPVPRGSTSAPDTSAASEGDTLRYAPPGSAARDSSTSQCVRRPKPRANLATQHRITPHAPRRVQGRRRTAADTLWLVLYHGATPPPEVAHARQVTEQTVGIQPTAGIVRKEPHDPRWAKPPLDSAAATRARTQPSPRALAQAARAAAAAGKQSLFRPTLQMLYIVGEIPTAGLHAQAFTRALADRDSVAALIAPRDSTLRIVGPSFSGSARSLSLALHRWRATHPRTRVSVVGGSATSPGAPMILSADSLVGYRSTVHSDDALTEALAFRVLCPLNVGDDQVVVLRESGTAYGRDVAAGNRAPGLTCPGGRTLHPSRFVQIPFPMNIATLRAELDGRAAAQGVSTTEIRSQSRARFTLRDQDRPGDHPLPTSQLTAPTLEVLMDEVEAAISGNRVHVVGILASDVRDKVFLATELRRRLRDVQLFTFEGNSLYLLPQNQAALRGTLVISTYPLSLQTQWWTPGRLNRMRLSFSNEGANGIHNAVLVQLGAGRQAANYGYPFVNYPGRVKPPVWVSAVGDERFLPVTVYTAADSAIRMIDMAAVPERPDEWPSLAFPTAVSIALLGLAMLLAVSEFLPGRPAREIPATAGRPRRGGLPATRAARLYRWARRVAAWLPWTHAGRLVRLRRRRHALPHPGIVRRAKHPPLPPADTTSEPVDAAGASADVAVPPADAAVTAADTAVPADAAGAPVDAADVPVDAAVPADAPADAPVPAGMPAERPGRLRRRRALHRQRFRRRRGADPLAPDTPQETVLDEVRWGTQNFHAYAYASLRALALLSAIVPVALITAFALTRRSLLDGPGIGWRWLVLGFLVVAVVGGGWATARLLAHSVRALRSVTPLGSWFAARGIPGDRAASRSWQAEVVLRALALLGGVFFFALSMWFAWQVIVLHANRQVTFPIFVYRASQLDGGVSPLVPLLLAAAGYVAWCTWHGWRIRDLRETTPFESAWDDDDGDDASPPGHGPTALPAAAGKDVRAVRMRLFKVVPDDTGLWGLGAAVLLAASLAMLIRRTIDGMIGLTAFDWILPLGIMGALVTTCWAVYRLLSVWRALDRVLQEMSETPLLPAFKRLPQRVAQLTRLTLWRPASRNVIDTVAAAQWRQMKQLHRQAQHEFAGVDMPRLALWSSVSALMAPDAPPPSRYPRRLRAGHDDSFQRLNEILSALWAREPDSEVVSQIRDELKKGPSDASTVDLVRRSVPTLTRLWLRAAEEFAAVQVVDYIEWVLQQLRTLALFLFISLLLTTALLSSYPYQPQSLTKLVFLFVLLGTVGTLLYVMAALNRDDVLSAIAKTDPGRVTWDRSFVVNAVAVGIVPLLTLISTELPDWHLLGWLDPLLRVFGGGH